jgi:transposase
VIGSTRQVSVWVFAEPVDMRKSYDSLSALVVAGLSRDVLSGDCFLFVGKDLRRAKVLLWDGTGLCVYQKRLEQGRFTAPWRKTPADRTAKSLRMTMSELSLFLEGSTWAGRVALSPEPMTLGTVARFAKQGNDSPPADVRGMR